ncbi:MAG TPA: hypothetical protein VMI34_03655 [Candidatus Bathyarchaeia archaeon]|nr:hypothetical protein [Candidatus Bathyarchaeia archaeon]
METSFRRVRAWPRSAPGSRSPVPVQALLVGLGGVAAGMMAGDWIGGVALLVLWAGWRSLPADDGPPILAMAFTFQWVQVSAGVFYRGLTGRSLKVIDLSDYRPMVLIGLGCLATLLVGLNLGVRLVRRPDPGAGARPDEVCRWPVLIAVYVASVVVTGTIQELAWEVPALTQAILVLTYARFTTLFMMFHRLTKPRVRLGWIALLVVAEVVLGFTGFFAGFREPLMLAAVALLGAFDRRRLGHWLVVSVFAGVMLFTGLIWMGIRTDYRQDFDSEAFAQSQEARLERVVALASSWLRQDLGAILEDLDTFVDRLWAIYYPALAVERVPAIVPHEHGAILGRALMHLATPRVLFPDKLPLESDSEMVVKYAGVAVAGAEQETSIAFGYAAESYVDFGVPLMFVPVFVFGVLMGMAYHGWLRIIRHRELAVGLTAVMFWMALYLFERSWIKTLGHTVTMMVYLGSATLVVDRLLLWTRGGLGRPARFRARRRLGQG